MRDYRQNYGETMKEQIQKWQKEHPKNMSNNSKKWKEEHWDGYIKYQKKWRKKNEKKYNELMSDLMRRRRYTEILKNMQ